MQLFEHIFGRRPSPLWFERGAARARHGPFSASAETGGQKIGIMGTAVAREGIGFVSSRAISEPELPVSFTLRTRLIASRVRIDRHAVEHLRDRNVHRYFCTFLAIAADDWDAVVRYVENRPEPKTRVRENRVDDDFRSLPQRVQNAIVEHLVAMGRLAPAAPGTAPLIRLNSSSVRNLGANRSTQDVVIYSRISGGDDLQTYATQFRVFFPERRIEVVGLET